MENSKQIGIDSSCRFDSILNDNGTIPTSQTMKSQQSQRLSQEKAYKLMVGYKTGLNRPTDSRMYVEWCEKLARSNSMAAMNQMGMIHQFGVQGVVLKNISKALQWYTKASQAGSQLAKTNMLRANQQMNSLLNWFNNMQDEEDDSILLIHNKLMQ